MKTLYVSDMDGTLLGSDSLVSPRSVEMLNRLSAGGVLFTVATARTAATVRTLLSEVDMRLPAVVMTGAALWNFRDKSYKDVKFMPVDLQKRAEEACHRFGVYPFIYAMGDDMATLDVYHAAPRMNKTEEGFYLERRKLKRFHLATEIPDEKRSRVVLMFATGDKERIASAGELVGRDDLFSSCCYPDIFSKEVAHLEIFNAGVSKAAAIMKLKKELGAERLVVFGDNLNDIPMLSVADVAVAVDNASSQVKEIADTVIEPNYTDSVPRFILEDSKLLKHC